MAGKMVVYLVVMRVDNLERYWVASMVGMWAGRTADVLVGWKVEKMVVHLVVK